MGMLSFAGKLLFLAIAGFGAGFYGVNVGSGSLVTIPALIFVGLPSPLVIATNRFAVIWGELAGVLGFRKYIAFDRRFAFLCGAVGSIGAFVGSRLVLSLSEKTMNISVAILLVIVAVFLLKRRNWGSGNTTLPLTKKILMLTIMPFIGLYAGFFGASHGTFSLMILTSCGMGFLQSAATTRVIGVMVAATAVISFIQAGAIQWPEGIALGAGFASGGWVGVRYSVRRGVGVIRKMLIVIAVASAAKLLWQTFS